MKKCFKCKQEKDCLEFSKDRSRKDGYDPCCKSCKNLYLKSRYYKDTSVKERSALLHRSYVERNRGYVYALLQQSKCVDCGDSRWQVLEFGHVRGAKRLGISEMIRCGHSLDVLEEEIDKCDVRCANCHRLKTAQQFGFRI